MKKKTVEMKVPTVLDLILRNVEDDRVFYNIVTRDIVAAQQMTAPTSLIFYMKYSYGRKTTLNTILESLDGSKQKV